MNYKNHIFQPEELKGQDYIEITFTHCQFIGSNLKFSSFSHCQFQQCDFSGSIFDGTNFSYSTFPESKLSYLDFSNALIKDCNFSHAVMVACVFQKLKNGSKFEKQKMDLTGCQFSNADLKQSVFVLCDLSKVDFAGSNLEGAVFEKCKLYETDFSGANINGTGFDTSAIRYTILDFDGFLQYGSSKGFVLPKPEKLKV